MVAAARLLSVVLSVSLALVSPALAQQRGSISGKVLDPDGLALPGATVVVTNAGTGFTREAITAETGAYSVPNLEPGTYDVAVTMAGFGNASRTGMVLSPGSSVTLELKLTVAGVQENLVVTGESPLVERTSNQIGGSLSRREIEEVPSNFRNFTGLTQLIPGHDAEPGARPPSKAARWWPTGRRRSRTSTCSTGCTTTTTASAAARARRCAWCSTTSRSTRCWPTSTARSTAAAPAPSSTW